VTRASDFQALERLDKITASLFLPSVHREYLTRFIVRPSVSIRPCAGKIFIESNSCLISWRLVKGQQILDQQRGNNRQSRAKMVIPGA
jgi:hypothetical protein